MPEGTTETSQKSAESTAEDSFSLPWMKRFLIAYDREKSVTHGCKAADIGRTTYWRGKKADKAFAEAVDAIDNQLVDVLEQSALSRAIEGYDEITYEGGVETKRVRKFSNALTIFLLKCRRPGTYNIAPGYMASEASSSDKAEDIRTALAAMDNSLGAVEADSEPDE